MAGNRSSIALVQRGPDTNTRVALIERMGAGELQNIRLSDNLIL
jgi:hypothetical protein